MNLNFSNFDLKNNITNLKDMIMNSSKYWIIFMILFAIITISMLFSNNLGHFNSSFPIFLIASILGIICVSYSISKYSEENLYKIAFIILIIFGLLCVFLMPICESSDTTEHLTRAEITSRGIIVPQFTGDKYTNFYNNGTNYVWDGTGFETISSINDLIKDRYETIFTSTHANEKINHTPVIVNQAFEQNPFYGYLPQAIGILIAKLLDLDAIWMLWFARIGNLICYSGIVAYAVKKTPLFKVPMIVTACIPMSMFQGASVSVDSMIISLGLLLIAYFFYMYDSKEKTITFKELTIFLIISLLLGLLKLPYFAFSFLIFAVPRKNFKSSNSVFISFLGIVIIGIIGVLWSRYATDALWHSYRAIHYLQNNVNSTQQMSFLLSNPNNLPLLISSIIERVNIPLLDSFLIYPPEPSGGGYTSASNLVSAILPMFLGGTYLFYPNETKIELRSKIISFFVLILIFGGICIIQFLTWTPHASLMIYGINGRYFLPLFALIPFIFGMNFVNEKNIELDYYILTLTIVFMSAMVMAFALRFY